MLHSRVLLHEDARSIFSDIIDNMKKLKTTVAETFGKVKEVVKKEKKEVISAPKIDENLPEKKQRWSR